MDGEALKPRDVPRIPGYRIEGVLGRGATGTVYRARQLSVDRLVALKVLHADLVGAQSAERRLQREARATARLAHPHIISAIDMGEVDGRWWYAMELVDGVSLQERIRAGPLSEREALRIAIPIAEALQHAFERGVVHRDVKPANILLERGGRALLVDLGLAFAEDDPLVTKDGATLGTPHYISPEQARDPSQADAQSDLWSLGATLYHAVCGRPPFSGNSVAEILSSVLYEPVPDPAALAPQVSRGFTLILRKCLARDRARRYATPAELVADLERVRERRAPNVRRAALEPVAGASARRLRRAALALPAAVALALLAWQGLGGGGTEPADEALPTAVASDPIERLIEAAEGPATELGPALARAVALVRALPPESREAQRAAGARAHLEARLAAEIQRFQLAAQPRFAAALREHQFEDAAALASTTLEREFAAATGGAALPPDLEESLVGWLGGLAARVDAERRAAEERLRAALREEWRSRVVPEVRAQLEAGRWRTARALLTTGLRAWASGAGLPRAGIPAAALETELARLRDEAVEPELARLDARWGEVDELLRAWVAERSAALAGAVEGRTLSDGASLLRTEWELELERRRLSVEEFPAGLLHLAHEELAKAERALSDQARALAVDDARRGLLELEDETLALWRARRYAEVAELHERASEEAWRQPVRAVHELRAREGRLLEDLLRRASAGVLARDGERVELALGTITYAGRLAAGLDPLARGFGLALEGGKPPLLVLRAGPGLEGALVVAPEIVESFARLASTPDDRLLGVLFRLREGRTREARDGLDAGALPRDEPLVADAEERVRASLAERRSEAEAVREAALARYRLALREGREGTDPARLAKRIERILREDSGALSAEEVSELRRLRDERLAELAPPSPSVEELLRPNVFTALGGARVRLRYDLDALKPGGLDPGTWIRDGQGRVSLRYALSDSDLLSRAGPSLVLREPLEVQSEAVDVRFALQPRADAPPDLLLASVCGFHVVIAAGRAGKPSRVLVDTGDPAQLVARARAGEGREVASVRPGVAYDLRVVATRARGVVLVELDGRRVALEQRPVPRNDLGDRLVALRSFEPLRLVTLTVEAAVR
ncbi:MAG: protein kinase [Planctomycetes bacterium]|nr:protein kinase [Planctomycetota bacterium]